MKKFYELRGKVYVAAAVAAPAAAIALALPVHAQVTFDSAAAQAALVATATGTQSFFWGQSPGVWLIAIGIGIVLTLVGFLAGRVGGKRRMRG